MYLWTPHRGQRNLNPLLQSVEIPSLCWPKSPYLIKLCLALQVSSECLAHRIDLSLIFPLPFFLDDGKLYDSSLIREGGELYSAPSKFVWVSRAQWYSSAVTEEGEVYTWCVTTCFNLTKKQKELIIMKKRGMGPLGHEANYQAAPKLVEALRVFSYFYARSLDAQSC